MRQHEASGCIEIGRFARHDRPVGPLGLIGAPVIEQTNALDDGRRRLEQRHVAVAQHGLAFTLHGATHPQRQHDLVGRRSNADDVSQGGIVVARDRQHGHGNLNGRIGQQTLEGAAPDTVIRHGPAGQIERIEKMRVGRLQVGTQAALGGLGEIGKAQSGGGTQITEQANVPTRH